MLLRLTRVLTVTAVVFSAFGVKAATLRDTKPRSLGTFSAWTAATFVRGGHRICYTFSRSVASGSSAPKHRSLLMVTRHPHSSPSLTITTEPAGAYASPVAVVVGQKAFPFFISKGVAYARENLPLVQAFKSGSTATARRLTSTHSTLRDTFNLQGFTAAYTATLKLYQA